MSFYYLIRTIFAPMITENTKKYEEWLTTIANTRLIYNTMAELEQMMDNKSIHSNGIKRSFTTLQKLRSAFRDLRVEVEQMTDGFISLDGLMYSYKRAWNFFRTYLARRSNPVQVAMEILRYYYPPYSKEGLGNKKINIYRNIIEEGISVPFLVLMLLKAIPGYDSKDGDAVEMPHKFEEVMELLEEFTEGCSYFSILPAITRAREEKCKSRLMLLYHVTAILNIYEAYTDKDNLYSVSADIKQTYVELDLDGYWNECGGKLLYTEFWHITAANNKGSYFATHWHKDANNRLTGVRFTMFLVEDTNDKLTAYILRSESIRRLMKGLRYEDADHVWYSTEMPVDKHPTALDLKRCMSSNVWKLNLNLTKVTEESAIETYQKWFKVCDIYKPFECYEYTFNPGIYAITASHIYVVAEQEGEYFKIPREAHEGFAQIQLDDNVGLMKMGNKIYLVFDELLLFIPVTPKELEKYQIERVNCIK